MSVQKTKRIIGAIAIAIIVTVFVSLLAWFNPFLKQQLYLSNFLYYERPTDNQVVVVSIDNETVDEEGLGKFTSWCRTYYIPVLKQLAEYQPTVIGIDLLLLKKSEGLCKNSLEVITNSTNPVIELERYFTDSSHPDDKKLGDVIRSISNLVLPSRVVPTNEEGTVFPGEEAYFQYPLKELQDEDGLTAHNIILYDSLGLVRDFVPLYLFENEAFEALSVKLVSEFFGFDDYSISPNELILTGEKGNLTIPLENYRMLVNYNHKPNMATESNGNLLIIPFMDVYKGTTDLSELIKDKIVLIGVRYSGSTDKYKTPISPDVQMPGVEIHAQAIQTILDEAWLYTQPFWQQIATIALLALISIAIIFALQIAIALPLLVVLIALYGMLLAPLLFRTQGLILNLVYPPLAIVTAAIVGYAYRYMTEFKQKTKVAGALGQYVNKEVAQNVLDQGKDGVQMGGDKQQITVLFTDIKGFTTISETLQPQSIVALLNEYFEVMAAEVVKQHGVVDKYEGDALMAFFEDKPGLASHQVRAAHTALKMREALSRLMAQWKNDGPLPGGETKPQIDFRVGLSSGEALVGNIGSSEHIQYTVIGDIVNLGSRLESANKKYQTSVMLSEATYMAIQNDHECRFLDVIKVKGKNQPVKIYELLALKSELSAEQTELVQIYNKALVLYFERKFPEALEVFKNELLQRWPTDYLANLYAGRCELLNRFPPEPDWDFVYKMDSK